VVRPLVAHCHLGLGKLHGRTSMREQAQEHLTTATTMYREMGMTYWLERRRERRSSSRRDDHVGAYWIAFSCSLSRVMIPAKPRQLAERRRPGITIARLIQDGEEPT